MATSLGAGGEKADLGSRGPIVHENSFFHRFAPGGSP
jgi:hypothetical protein